MTAVWRSLAEVPSDFGPTVVTLGNFDGVHRGHQAVLQTLVADARAAGCAIFYAGQYLQPSARHLPVIRFVTPEEFADLQTDARRAGFAFAACAPLVRSSYHEAGQSAYVRRMTQANGGCDR